MARSKSELAARALSRLERFVEVSSPSSDLSGLERMARLLIAEATELGLPARLYWEPDADGRSLPVVEIRSALQSERPLLLVGHFDTVLPAATPKRHGDRLVATGAIDMKGGLAALFGALERLADPDRAARRELDFRLIVVPDEEVGGAISRRAVERHGATARALWVLEPGEPASSDSEAETIVAGRRGLFHFQLEARGRAAHSGLHFWNGRSAIAAAAEWTTEASALSRPHDGPTVNVARFVGGDQGFVEKLGEHAGVLGTARELNVVPDRARLDGEARFLRAADEAPLVAHLEEVTRRVGDRHGIPLRFTRGERIAPVDPEKTGREWIERAVAIAAEAGWKLEVEENRGGISFPNFLTEPGRIPVLDGLGPVGGGMHTRDEYVSLASLDRRIHLLATLLELEAAGGGSDA